MSETPSYLSVKALTRYLKRKFDVDPHLQKVYVQGEVSNFRLRPNGHQYFSLKEDNVKINVAMFQHAFAKIGFQLEEGMKVYAVGRVSVYEPSGSYQMTLESLQPDGIGALYLRLEQLKKKLQAEGVFDLPKKKPVVYPKRIAVVTSPSGAVIQDIMTTLKRRYPIAQVIVFPTRVQGKEAVAEIVDAFHRIQHYPETLDTVIVARGGGSFEDLDCFNDEAVARAIIACQHPVISAIGHETDTTIADLVSDLRAPTPTAAAELASPELQGIYQHLEQTKQRLEQAMQQRLKVTQQHVQRLAQATPLVYPERLYQAYRQQVDLMQDKFQRVMVQTLQTKQQQLTLQQQRLYHQQPSQRIQMEQQRVQHLEQRTRQSVAYHLQQLQTQLEKTSQLLDAFSPLKTLSRGYTMITVADEPVRTIQQLHVDQVVNLTLADGTAQAMIQATQVNQ